MKEGFEMEMTYQHAHSLRNLYFVRTVFQVIWAGAVIATALMYPAVAAVLLILYPLWDVVCTVYDLRYSALDRNMRRSQTINAVLGTVAALGIAVKVFNQPAYAIVIFGAWAFVAGLLQLVAGLIRRKQIGGQWAMVVSGVQSTVAGAAFGLGGLQGKFHAKDLGGYAIFGGVYFLIGGLLLTRKLSYTTADKAVR